MGREGALLRPACVTCVTRSLVRSSCLKKRAVRHTSSQWRACVWQHALGRVRVRGGKLSLVRVVAFSKVEKAKKQKIDVFWHSKKKQLCFASHRSPPSTQRQ
jgi:hypothetical protein